MAPKLRIASYYENGLGRNDGNPLYMWNAFKQVPGVESGHLRPDGDLTKFGQWDLHFEADWGQDALKGVLPYEPVEIPRPSAFWCSDAHLGYDWRLEHSRKFDYVFCAQREHVERFKKAGIQNVSWMPHAVEPAAYDRPHVVKETKPGSGIYEKNYCEVFKKYDVCFVGHINSENRVAALDRLFREFPNFYYGQRLFEDAAEKFWHSKIVFNNSIKDDLNMRTFEALATRSFLLTERVSDIEELFEDGKHLVLYRSLDEMVDKAKYYLAHDEEREKIALAGYEEVMAKHTFKNRVEQVLRTAGLWEKLKAEEKVPAAV